MTDIASIKLLFKGLSDRERKQLLPNFTDDDFANLMKQNDEEFITSVMSIMPTTLSTKDEAVHTTYRWFNKKLCALSKEGIKHLRELEEEKERPSSHVDRKLLRYLKQLRKMYLEVPAFYCSNTDPRALFKHLQAFCIQNDIPTEVTSRIIPTFISYIETGHMRPVIFVGEKGCGKTTAIRMLVEEALRLPTKVIKVPQTDGSHGMTGDSGTYQSADVGCIAKARLETNSMLLAYLFDEIDKVTHDRNRASIDDELLSITDESCSDVYDNYLETTIVGLEHCPMFFTANDLQKVSPILADRCTIIQFPNADTARIKSISRKFVKKKLAFHLYDIIVFDYELMDKYIDILVEREITSLRKHQQMIEMVIENALETALTGKDNDVVAVTEEMFLSAKKSILSCEKRHLGFQSR